MNYDNTKDFNDLLELVCKVEKANEDLNIFMTKLSRRNSLSESMLDAAKEYLEINKKLEVLKVNPAMGME